MRWVSAQKSSAPKVQTSIAEVWELRWKNGRRIYFSFIPEKKILLLLGGNKNGQDKDIRKAKSLLKKYTT
ncbi:MAG: hypothetical protein K940chlam9_01068 [Chlamydiae bacterium]|nr:hypothetical protein [Chlamydiota bacterium]